MASPILHPEPIAPAPRPSYPSAPAPRTERTSGEWVDPAVDGRVVHEYDGIQECDNRLPNWWLWTLYAAIIFGMGYWFDYYVIGAGVLPMENYRREMASVYAQEAARVRASGQITDESLRILARDPVTVGQGHRLFTTTCAPCHGPNAGGVIGPNLTDDFWLHGGSPRQVFHTVSEGVTARGMPAWGPQLGNDRVQSVVAYLVTLHGTNVAGGKAPQGQHEL